MRNTSQMNEGEYTFDRVESVIGILQSLTPHMNRLRELHSLTRWIPLSERLPTEEDADERGKVLFLFWGEHYESRYWNLGRDYGMTHWKRIDKPEGN